MKFLRSIFDSQARHFGKGGKLEFAYPLYEMVDTFLYTPGTVTKGASHVRDGLDVKRMMTTVVIALLPCVFMAMYNTGYQAHLAISQGAQPLETWQTSVAEWLGYGAWDPTDVVACIVHGVLYYLPVLIVTFAVGGGCEALFALVRRHEINEGFLVTGMLFPLVLPPTIPLWQVAIGIAFGVIIGKEIFGGTGMNILNPALTARVFLFFAYPAQISGDQVWIAADTGVDGLSGATWLAEAAVSGQAVLAEGVEWWDAFLGFVPGSMGETSTAACLFGALVLIVSRVGSWRIMLGVAVGSYAATLLLNAVGSETNLLLNVPFEWHFVLGGWAFGAVFMATDPVSAAHSETGRYIYGFLIGVLAILIRVVNPAYPEGMMLAILFMNLFAALIDHFVVQANVKRRRARYAA
ncbi:MAG: NADH:ubiquinone reductase (Na(+)-transporting) subunit B [Bryobacterales bacterium]|nr:NADH:ubiquinone reductase (Na(+)-transporting) subunit B [Bryobacterales bacterium]MDE0293509.1 NADH:ubiquinone reductase (Na(+)-transporting) subunit B [Bryobacterales bacterium]MDE0434507.1 NADH:ubiquinone reductase (Na(+)-transporting) subunit B [Bryobacterales bacterium]